MAQTEYKLFVRNLAFAVTDDILYNTFAEHGEITFARLCTDRETNRSRGFGFVSYKTKEAADKAIAAMNGFELEGRNIEVKEADGERRERPKNFGGDRGDRPKFGGGQGSNECFAFKKGNCKFGNSCRFSHENGGASRPRSNDQYEDEPRKQHRSDEGAEGYAEEPRRDRKKKGTRE